MDYIKIIEKLSKDEIVLRSSTYWESLSEDDFFLDKLYWLIDIYNRNYKLRDGFNGIEDVIKIILSRYYKPVNWNCNTLSNLYNKCYGYDILYLPSYYDINEIKYKNYSYFFFNDIVSKKLIRSIKLHKINSKI
jgi:hypothetical protein